MSALRRGKARGYVSALLCGKARGYPSVLLTNLRKAGVSLTLPGGRPYNAPNISAFNGIGPGPSIRAVTVNIRKEVV